MSYRRAFVVVALALAPSAPLPAAAQTAADSPETIGRTLGEEGLRRFQSGRWQEAYELFEDANRAVHAPTLVLYMAHCQERLGHLPAAHRLYREVARMELAADAPVQFHSAQRVARQELDALGQRLAFIKILVTSIAAAERGGVRLRVDGSELSAADLEELALEPGAHVIEASMPGRATLRLAITAPAGRLAEIVVPLGLPAAPANDAAPEVSKGDGASASKGDGASASKGDGASASKGDGASASKSDGASASKGQASHVETTATPLLVSTAIAFGMGGAALVGGVATGALSLRDVDAVKSRCSPSGHCLASDQANAAVAGRLADASTSLFVAGGAAVVTGIVLAVLHARSSKAPAVPATGSVHVDIGPAYWAVGGVF